MSRQSLIDTLLGASASGGLVPSELRTVVYFFVLFERGASAGADLVVVSTLGRVEPWIVAHDRLVENGQASEAPVGILRHLACGRVRTLYDW
jgi:hypothetical protein